MGFFILKDRILVSKNRKIRLKVHCYLKGTFITNKNLNEINLVIKERIKMNKFHHLTISVSNIKKSSMFYKKLGFKISKGFERKDYPAKFRDLKLDSFCLRLVEFQNKKKQISSSKNPIKSFSVIGIKHLALEVKNLEKIKEILEKQKTTFLDEKNIGTNAKIQRGVSGVNYIFLKDPDGINIELVEKLKNGK